VTVGTAEVDRSLKIGALVVHSIPDFSHLTTHEEINTAKVSLKAHIADLEVETQKARDRYENLDTLVNERRFALCMLKRRKQDICDHLIVSNSITFGYLFTKCDVCGKTIHMEKEEKVEA